MSTENAISAGLVIVLLFVGVILFSSKLENDAAALRSRANDVIATATEARAVMEAFDSQVKAGRLSGAANGMRIGAAVMIVIGAWLVTRTD